jgi:hypothetical protein
VFESKNLLGNALQSAIYDRLCSAVYYALNYTIGYLEGLDSQNSGKLLREWRELGAYAVAGIVLLSTLPEGPSLPHAVRLIPWIADYLRDYDEEAVLPIVQQWLDGEPLAERISANPQDEEMKVRELKRLVSAIDENAKPTVSKIIRSV